MSLFNPHLLMLTCCHYGAVGVNSHAFDVVIVALHALAGCLHSWT